MCIPKVVFYMSKEILEAISRAILAIVRMIAGLFGRSGPARPKTSLPTTTDDVADTYRDRYKREVANDHALASDLGRAVHQYATADDPGVRCAVYLGTMDLYQMGWLLSLSDGDLAKLAQAGPKPANWLSPESVAASSDCRRRRSVLPSSSISGKPCATR